MEHLGAIVRRDHELLYPECRDESGYLSTDRCDWIPFWWTRTGQIVKWSLFLGFTTIILLYLVVGYVHAKRRVKNNLPPLGYHRFLVARRDLARVDPRYQYPQADAYQYNPNNNGQQYAQQQGAYGMYAMPPPPVYDPNAPRPPVYQYDVESGSNGVPPPAMQPPAGATKVDPSQQPVSRPADQQAEDYSYVAPPPGPPPPSAPQGQIPQQNTGSTNPFRN